MKYLVILLFLECVVFSFCSAQSSNELIGVTKKGPKTPVRTIAIKFISDDTCNINIDGKDRGEIINDKVVKLLAGTHRISFESLETGKTIKVRSFLVTKDTITGGSYNYVVAFK